MRAQSLRLRGGRAPADDCCGSVSFNDRSKLTKITDTNTLETIGYITSLGAAAQMMIAATFGCGATPGSTGRSRCSRDSPQVHHLRARIHHRADLRRPHQSRRARTPCRKAVLQLCCSWELADTARACAAITFGLTIARRVTLLRGVLYVIVQARRCVLEAAARHVR